jgi:cell division protein FtsW
MREKKFDKPFLISVIILVVAGAFIFTSASLGLLARNGATFGAVAFNQFFFGIFLGSIALIVMAKLDYKILRRFAFVFFVLSTLLTLAVFIPHLGFSHGGARRWLTIGSYTLQPSEIFKMGFIIYLAAWLTSVKSKIHDIRYGLIPFGILTFIAGIILLLQPDTDTFLIIFCAGLAMFIAAGCKWRDIVILGLLMVMGLGLVYTTRPYIRARVNTFLNPSENSLSASYQIQQSQIAIGSGQVFGRGFGQSVQKFNFLPEPIGDSIFAVAAEEFGFLGSAAIILLFLFFGFRGLKIAVNVPDMFGRLVIVGIVILIISESFMNIAAMLGIVPLSGTPLLFISHGGTALLFTLAEVGIILNISKQQRS